ncbi:HTH domain-containing protein [Halalkalicoccus sp. NIPERK01]|uniref:HTH domain-containing protein n=1 Tax=Halalkalicoccus sp. NIPERK01 TaxID=3053469 RepID=UPI00256F54D3|nr:HTH domain-containing protein [Halalkalicoccus sp. NIPERK01]MDL5360974.1 HTH domain-containing protein [Halalkalicoccus sp. NIPERK01]
MATEEVPDTLAALAEKMATEYRESEYEIALALANAQEPLSTEELAEETGYTERTIKKRVDTLEEELGGDPLLRRDDEDRPVLHPTLANAVREHAAS